MDICEKNRLVARKRNVNRILSSKKHLASLPEDRRKLLQARLIGYIMGDGSVTSLRNSKKPRYAIRFYPDDEFMLGVFIGTFRELYKEYPSIKRLGAYTKVSISCLPAWIDLTDIASFGSLEWRVPIEFLDDWKLRKAWLRAFFDCEAYVGPRSIQIQSVNGPGIYEVQELLDLLGIKSTMTIYERRQKNWNTNFILTISGIQFRKRYHELIGFDHKGKRLALEQTCNFIKNSDHPEDAQVA